ncbi:GspH/FimT family pseudopilin [Aureimonas sp. N4]|uniref:GspH/FimT family pseudopilin n=1 Tax=Aureimonas sp. N4 TaxID=1638165 RepID=UPI0007862355|nr:GspH/FimT family pseudopilin [Aureimonas sp. N4]
MKTRPGEAGFTLVEMLVVLAIMALVAAGSSYALAGSRPARMVAATEDRLVADLQRTRLDAMRSGRMRSLAFDGAARLWRREGAQPFPLPDGITLQLTTAREAGRAGTGEATIVFLPDGRSTGGKVEIAGAGLRRMVEVNWLTGAVQRAVR